MNQNKTNVLYWVIPFVLLGAVFIVGFFLYKSGKFDYWIATYDSKQSKPKVEKNAFDLWFNKDETNLVRGKSGFDNIVATGTVSGYVKTMAPHARVKTLEYAFADCNFSKCNLQPYTVVFDEVQKENPTKFTFNIPSGIHKKPNDIVASQQCIVLRVTDTKGNTYDPLVYAEKMSGCLPDPSKFRDTALKYLIDITGGTLVFKEYNMYRCKENVTFEEAIKVGCKKEWVSQK